MYSHCLGPSSYSVIVWSIKWAWSGWMNAQVFLSLHLGILSNPPWILKRVGIAKYHPKISCSYKSPWERAIKVRSRFNNFQTGPLISSSNKLPSDVDSLNLWTELWEALPKAYWFISTLKFEQPLIWLLQPQDLIILVSTFRNKIKRLEVINILFLYEQTKWK